MLKTRAQHLYHDDWKYRHPLRNLTWCVRPVCGMQRTILSTPLVLNLWNLVHDSLPFASLPGAFLEGSLSVDPISATTSSAGVRTWQYSHRILCRELQCLRKPVSWNRDKGSIKIHTVIKEFFSMTKYSNTPRHIIHEGTILYLHRTLAFAGIIKHCCVQLHLSNTLS